LSPMTALASSSRASWPPPAAGTNVTGAASTCSSEWTRYPRRASWPKTAVSRTGRSFAANGDTIASSNVSSAFRGAGGAASASVIPRNPARVRTRSPSRFTRTFRSWKRGARCRVSNVRSSGAYPMT
jgi:hypothetical protein